MNVLTHRKIGMGTDDVETEKHLDLGGAQGPHCTVSLLKQFPDRHSLLVPTNTPPRTRYTATTFC